uniref:histidine-tRNA ligase n=1 Tax=Hypnea nidifica TaxID=673448 RepID=UPI0027D9E22C|nr:histidine-tRNA ligase [Hypnea nidifica]WCH54426.1 histidine-tRNA ligase [Hypnea nidifica]
MQLLRGTKDILPDEIILWQYIEKTAAKIMTLANYNEIRTPIIESTSLFKRSIGNGTDIVNKEMYSFLDQNSREITLRPEGTASIARAFINSKLYTNNKTQRLWYLGPMFRYERPQQGRQRQFHQLGIECIGSLNPIADAEVIRIAHKLLNTLECTDYIMEINSIGQLEERKKYKQSLIEYLEPYIEDLDNTSRNKLYTNPLKILDSKNTKTQEIIYNAPCLYDYLEIPSKQHFEKVCEYLDFLGIQYNINKKLVRGLDYYNYTAFEIKTNSLGTQDTICGGGRYDSLIKELGGPNVPSVGWAIGIERLLITIKNQLHKKIEKNKPLVYLAVDGQNTEKEILNIVEILEKKDISYNLDLDNNSLQQQLKKADKQGAKACLILRDYEIKNNYITLKKLSTSEQKQFSIFNIDDLIRTLENMSQNL